MKKLFKFQAYNTLTARALVEYIRTFGPCEVEVREPTRNSEQNAALHQAFTDLAKQVDWYGQKLPAGVWKRLCVSAWLREQGRKPYMVPALDGVGVDVIYEKTSTLSVKDCSALLDWVYSFGSEHNVKFRTREVGPY